MHDWDVGPLAPFHISKINNKSVALLWKMPFCLQMDINDTH